MSNKLTTFLLFLILKSICSIEWKCVQGCSLPTIETNRMYCQTLGNKNGNEIVSESYYNMMPMPNKNKFFTGVFSYYDSTSSHYQSYGLSVSGVSANSWIYSNTWNTIYKNTMIRVYVNLTHVTDTKIKVDTIFSLFDTEFVIGQSTEYLTYDQPTFGYISLAKFRANIGDTYSDTGKIYIYDAYTQHNGEPLNLITKNIYH